MVTSVKNNLHSKMNFVYYSWHRHVVTNFLVSNARNISKIHINQGKKLHDLFSKNSYHNSVTMHNPDNAIFNFVGFILSDSVKSLLITQLNFTIPPNVNCAD